MTGLASRKTINEAAPPPPGLAPWPGGILPGDVPQPASPLPLRCAGRRSQHRFPPAAGWAAAGAQVCSDGFHHLPEPIGLDWFRDRPNGHLYRSRGKLDLLRHLQPSVRLPPAFNDDSRSIHDIHLAFSYQVGWVTETLILTFRPGNSRRSRLARLLFAPHDDQTSLGRFPATNHIPQELQGGEKDRSLAPSFARGRSGERRGWRPSPNKHSPLITRNSPLFAGSGRVF